MQKTQVPVLVVGAGASGTMLTLELARRGVPARTVDRLPGPGDTSKAITVHARTLEIIERIDKRLADRYLDRGIHNKGYVLHFVDGAGRRSEVRPGIDFTTVDSRYNFLLVHRQSETEQWLREYTADFPGRVNDAAVVERMMRLTELALDNAEPSLGFEPSLLDDLRLRTGKRPLWVV